MPNPNAPKRIIIADDHDLLRTTLTVFIKNYATAPVEIDQVRNGRELTERARIAKYDLIITDQEMPEMTGLEAIRTIRDTDEKNKETPIYLLTMHGGLPSCIAEAKRVGANGCINKQEVTEEIPKILARHNF